MVRVRVNPYPKLNLNHNQSEESHSNQSEARIPDLSYGNKYLVLERFCPLPEEEFCYLKGPGPVVCWIGEVISGLVK